MNSYGAYQRYGAIMTKRFDDLYEDIIDYKNLKSSYYQVTKGDRKYAPEAVMFHMFLERNLVQLWRDLKYGKYKVGSYRYHVVYEPKERGIWAPSLRDKIVQTAVHNVLKNVYQNVFIADSYACIDGKGHQRAAFALQRDMRIAQREFKDPWIVSVDVSKFFYTIDRDITKRLYRKKIACKKTLWLLDTLINSSPKYDPRMFEGLDVNPHKSNEIGLPLGCTTSQDSANLNLNELDQYVMRYLGHRYHVRYMDDLNVVVDGKEQAQSLKREICAFMREKLNLAENPKKSQIFPLQQGVNAYGYKIWTTHMKVRDDSKRKMKRKMKAMDKKLGTGEIDLHELKQSVNSWLGHARHSNSYNLAKKLFAPYPYIEIEGDEYFGKRRLS